MINQLCVKKFYTFEFLFLDIIKKYYVKSILIFMKLKYQQK